MKRILTIILFFALITGAFSHMGCKKSDETDEFKLTVSMTAGVTGTPEAGAHIYSNNEQVPYEYTLEYGYVDLRVILDGVEVDPSGVITITGTHVISSASGPDPAAFPLTVAVTDGVTGTPSAGIYYYYAGDQVDYSFALADDYENLSVKLDGVDVPSSGTVNVSKAHVLTAGGTLHYEIQGDWSMTESYGDGSYFEVTLTFSGDDESGTVTDTDGGVGTYTVDGIIVNFDLVYPDVTYQYTGFFPTKDTLSGNATRTVSNGNVYAGTFGATRNSSTLNGVSVAPYKKGDTHIQ